MELTFYLVSFTTLSGAAADIFVLKNGGPRPAPRVAMLAKTLVIGALVHWALYFRVFGLADTTWADPAFLDAALAVGIPVLLLAVVTDAIAFTAWMTKHGSD